MQDGFNAPRYAFHSCSALIRKGMDMRNRNLSNWVLLLLLAVVSSPTQAQKSVTAATEPKARTITTSDLTTPVLKEIQDIEERMVAVAADFPDGLYNTYRPKGDPDVRTPAEILLHVAEQNQSAASLIRTKQQQEALITSGKRANAKEILTFLSKPDTVAKVKASFDAVQQAIQDNPDPKNMNWWLYVIAHSNGHFGNLVTYHRENGLVPPTSRQ